MRLKVSLIALSIVLLASLPAKADCVSDCVHQLQAACSNGLSCPDPTQQCRATCSSNDTQETENGCFVFWVGGVPNIVYCW